VPPSVIDEVALALTEACADVVQHSGGEPLLLMKALVDRLDFRHDPDGRHRVTLVKQLGNRPALRLLE
jgi:anti-sigma regulatory factor (Ser/Thr protein kinase)